MDARYFNNSGIHREYVANGYLAFMAPKGTIGPERFKDRVLTAVVTRNLSEIAAIPADMPDWAVDNVVRQLQEWEVHYVLRLDGRHFSQENVSDSVWL